MKGTLISHWNWSDDVYFFTSTADYQTIKKWLNENGIFWYPAFFMQDTVCVVSKKSYMAAKLTWL